MNDSSVSQDTWDYYAEQARAEAEKRQAAELAAAEKERAEYAVTQLYRNFLGRDPDPEGLAHWSGLFGSSVEPEEKAAFVKSGMPEIQASPVNLLTQQILGQNITDKWSGVGYGSAEANARDMAKILAGIGITDIRQFGEIQTPDGVTFGNKITGQVVPNTYSERQTGNAWGGTFAGKGNTGYRVQFAEDGTPVFYTTGASSNDLANLLADNKLLNVAANLAATYFGGPAGVAALQAAQGKDVGDIAKAAALSYIGGQVASGVSGAEGVVDALGQTGANIAGNFAGAVATGGDPVAALVSGGIGAAVPEITSQIPGFSELNKATKDAINKVVASTLASGGDVSPTVLVNAAFKAAQSYIPSMSPASSDFESGSFKYDQVFDPKTAGMVDMSEQSFDPSYQFTTDFGVGADYSLGPKSDGQGFQITAPPEVFNPDGSVNYDLLDYDQLAQLGMDMPKSPNLDAMGGGQGLRIPVEGGYITEEGFIPKGYTPDLGDPGSFINQPAPGENVSIQGALDAGAKATLADLNKTKTPAGKQPGTTQSGVDLNALMALLGGGQQAPTVVSSGQDNSADIELMQDIFGTSLSAPSAGNTDTRENEFARLLRS